MKKARNKRIEGSAPARKGGGRLPHGKSGRAQRRTGTKKRRRRGNNILMYLLILFFMLSTAAVLIFTVFFKIKAVEVEGGERYRKDKLIATSGILLEENMFRLDDRAIEKRMVDGYSYIESVRIRRELPETVVLEISEAAPLGAVDQGAGYILIGENRRVLEKGVPNPPEGVPVVRGIEALSLNEGDYIPEENAQQLTLLEAFITAVKESGFSYYTAVDLSDPYNLTMYYGDQITYLLGTESELAYKLASIRKVLEQENLIESFEGTIDASFEGEVWTRPSRNPSPVLPESELPEEKPAKPVEEEEGQEAAGEEPEDEAPQEESAEAPPEESGETEGSGESRKE